MLSVKSAGTKGLPTFFLVGAPKAGTTSLYHYLGQHPEIYLSPIKEPNYFASEVRPENFSEELQKQISRDMHEVQEYLCSPMVQKRFGGIVLEWENYIRLFQNVKEQTSIGEASVCYLWSKTAASNIFSRIPDAKIFMVLRNPAERAFSQYLHAIGNGLVRKPFREEIQACLRRRSQGFEVLKPFLGFGLYYEQVKRYLGLFPRENVRIYFFDDYQKWPAQMLEDIFRFLNVNPSFVPNASHKHLEPQIPRSIGITYLLKKYGMWKRVKNLSPHALRPFFHSVAFRQHKSLVMDSRDRDWMVGYYQEDVRKLSDLLGRDLTAWLH